MWLRFVAQSYVLGSPCVPSLSALRSGQRTPSSRARARVPPCCPRPLWQSDNVRLCTFAHRGLNLNEIVDDDGTDGTHADAAAAAAATSLSSSSSVQYVHQVGKNWDYVARKVAMQWRQPERRLVSAPAAAPVAAMAAWLFRARAWAHLPDDVVAQVVERVPSLPAVYSYCCPCRCRGRRRRCLRVHRPYIMATGFVRTECTPSVAVVDVVVVVHLYILARSGPTEVLLRLLLFCVLLCALYTIQTHTNDVPRWQLPPLRISPYSQGTKRTLSFILQFI